ncbi:MAG TPA: hypothetical protein PLN69_09565 [bacterium]|nr:hypothetical protein [bacterium]
MLSKRKREFLERHWLKMLFFILIFAVTFVYICLQKEYKSKEFAIVKEEIIYSGIVERIIGKVKSYSLTASNTSYHKTLFVENESSLNKKYTIILYGSKKSAFLYITLAFEDSRWKIHSADIRVGSEEINLMDNLYNEKDESANKQESSES